MLKKYFQAILKPGKKKEKFLFTTFYTERYTLYFMVAMILDGKKVAEELYKQLLLEASLIPVIPNIKVVLIGEDPASQIYVKNKTKKCLDLGFRGEVITLPETVSQKEVIELIEKLNQDSKVHGILVQLPIPKQLDTNMIIQKIHPMKDLDCLTYENIGRLVQGVPRFIPCTPGGILELLKFYHFDLKGMNAVVIGRSEIVGKPMASLLLSHHASVSIIHSKTTCLSLYTKMADLLIVAAGKQELIRKEHIKNGGIVIDVGIHRHLSINGKIEIIGDVHFPSAQEQASALSPVPGGVGPLTIAYLMKNLLEATKLQFK